MTGRPRVDPIARHLHIARTRLGWSQVELGERAGVTSRTIGRVERGTTSPTLETLRRLAVALGVELTARGPE